MTRRPDRDERPERLYDCRWLPYSGIGRHAREVASRLGDGWSLLLPQPDRRPMSPVEPLRLLAELRGRRAPGVYVSPGYNLPLLGRGPAVCIPTIHDLAYVHGATPDRARRLYFDRLVRPAVRRAPVVLTGTRSSAADVAAWAAIPAERIVVIGNGLAEVFRRADLRRDGGDRDGTPVVLGLASNRPNKNLPRLLEVAAAVRARRPEVELHLVGGTDGDLPPGASAPGVRLLGFVGDDELVAAYRRAAVFVTLSSTEGFNLPLIEAVALGVPVVASDIDVHREVAMGLETVTLVDPADGDAVVDAVERAIDRRPEAGVLARGRDTVVARYDWDAVAARLEEAVARVAP